MFVQAQQQLFLKSFEDVLYENLSELLSSLLLVILLFSFDDPCLMC